MAQVALEQVSKTYRDGTHAVRCVDLTIPDGSLAVLVGPSGCGKTTLLRMLAGLETITEGKVWIGDRVVNNVSAKDRDVAMVFQSYALYPHMSVFDNMAFSLKMRHVPRRETAERVLAAAKTLAMEDQLRKKPRTLSGGQRQRVAMGRALVRQPQVYLMDEPLSNLDAKLRVQMRAEIARLQRDLGVTTIYVTHDQTEAMTLGDTVAVMRGGVLQQVDSPRVLFESPRNMFVASFIGSPQMNFVEALVLVDDGRTFVEFGGHRLEVPASLLEQRPALRHFEGRRVALGIRPEDMQDASFIDSLPDGISLPVSVDLREDLGRDAYLHFCVSAPPPVLSKNVGEILIDVADPIALEHLEEQTSEHQSTLVARVNGRSRAREGDRVVIAVDTASLHFFDPRTGDAINAGAAPPREVVAVT